MALSLKPQNSRFYELYAEQARLLVASSEALVDLMGHFENVEMKTAHLKDIEHEADNITHDLYRLVHQTFVTPFDREDIAALAQSMDDVVDFIEEASTTIRIYGIEAPTKQAQDLADLVRLQTLELQKAIEILGQRGRLKDILQHVIEVHRLENEGDVLFLSAMGALFHDGWSTTDIIKWRDIYALLEEATDSCERVGHALEAIVLKHA